MDKIETRADSRAFMRSAQAFAALDDMDQHLPRTSRGKINRDHIADVCRGQTPVDLRRLLA